MRHRRRGVWKILVEAGIGAVALVFLALMGLALGFILSLKPWG